MMEEIREPPDRVTALKRAESKPQPMRIIGRTAC